MLSFREKHSRICALEGLSYSWGIRLLLIQQTETWGNQVSLQPKEVLSNSQWCPQKQWTFWERRLWQSYRLDNSLVGLIDSTFAMPLLLTNRKVAEVFQHQNNFWKNGLVNHCEFLILWNIYLIIFMIFSWNGY